MPTDPFLEINRPERHIGPPTDYSTYVRAVRLNATLAPYLTGSGRPTLGWKSPELAAQMRLTSPIYGIVRGILPNRS